jgi:hypothetical protein
MVMEVIRSSETVPEQHPRRCCPVAAWRTKWSLNRRTAAVTRVTRINTLVCPSHCTSSRGQAEQASHSSAHDAGCIGLTRPRSKFHDARQRIQAWASNSAMYDIVDPVYMQTRSQ